MEIRCCYQVLELSPGTSQPELKQAYKDLVQVWHPDRFSHDPRLQAKAAQKLTQINKAYETLERTLAHRDRPQAPPPVQAQTSAPPETSDLEDLTQRSSTGSRPTATQAVKPQPVSSNDSTQNSSTQKAADYWASAQSGSYAKGRNLVGRNTVGRNTVVRERDLAYRHLHRRPLSIRWFFSAIAMSCGVVLLMCTLFLIAYAIAQQPGLFLLPAVALVGVYGYRVLRIN